MLDHLGGTISDVRIYNRATYRQRNSRPIHRWSQRECGGIDFPEVRKSVTAQGAFVPDKIFLEKR